MNKAECMRLARKRYGKTARLEEHRNAPRHNAPGFTRSWQLMQPARKFRRVLSRAARLDILPEEIDAGQLADTILSCRGGRRPQARARADQQLRKDLLITAANVTPATIRTAVGRLVTQINRIEMRGERICPGLAEWNYRRILQYRHRVGKVTTIAGLFRCYEVFGEGDTWAEAWTRATNKEPLRC